MILSYYIKSASNKAEQTVKQSNQYDMLKISLQDTFSNKEKKFKSKLRKYRQKQDKIKKLEAEISSALSEYKTKNIENTLRTIESFVSEPNDTLLSTCENETMTFSRDRRRIKNDPEKFRKGADSFIKYVYKSNFMKMNQLIEINKWIMENYEKEIKTLIKNRSVFRLDNKLPSPKLKRRDSQDEGENDLVSFVTCGNSRRPEKPEKKEDCIIF